VSESSNEISAPGTSVATGDDTTVSPVLPVPPVLHAVPAPVTAATWAEKEPDRPWCAESLAAALPWAATHAYAHEATVQHDGPWHVAGATRRGRVHAHAGDFREDAMAVHVADDLVLAVVSDGAGSATHSRVGSEHTCRTVRETVVAAWPALATAGDADALATALGAALGDGVAAAATALRAVAAQVEGVQPRDFRCTVIAAAWGRSARGDEALVVVQVGDGIAAVLDADGTVTRTADGDSGDFSGEVTCFVPDEGCEARARAVVRLDPARTGALLVATDGIEDPFYPITKRGADIVRQLRDGNDATLDGFVRQPAHGPVLGHPDAAANLATWLRFEKRGENDDRTIVALTRRDAAAPRG
jgi:hypothetical protein